MGVGAAYVELSVSRLRLRNTASRAWKPVLGVDTHELLNLQAAPVSGNFLFSSSSPNPTTDSHTNNTTEHRPTKMF
jgi:hypothetical protein